MFYAVLVCVPRTTTRKWRIFFLLVGRAVPTGSGCGTYTIQYMHTYGTVLFLHRGRKIVESSAESHTLRNKGDRVSITISRQIKVSKKKWLVRLMNHVSRDLAPNSIPTAAHNISATLSAERG